MNTYIYIHVCCINNWKEIFGKLLSDIRASGLYDKVTKIRCSILYIAEDFTLFIDPKIEIISKSIDLSLYETPTINALYADALKEDFNVLYLHTKGVKHMGMNPHVTDWVKYMSYFNIYRHELCMEMLKDYDAVGVNLHTSPTHFSGNFWWSKSEHLRKLQPCTYDKYCSPEFWVGCVKGEYKELWNSGVNHYYFPYKEANYLRPPT